MFNYIRGTIILLTIFVATAIIHSIHISYNASVPTEKLWALAIKSSDSWNLSSWNVKFDRMIQCHMMRSHQNTSNFLVSHISINSSSIHKSISYSHLKLSETFEAYFIASFGRIFALSRYFGRWNDWMTH